jgi:para-aminobenzoate synthetase component 1
MPVTDPDALAVVGGRLLTGLCDVTSDLAALETAGTWAVALAFDGAVTCARFRDVRAARPWPGKHWWGPLRSSWTTSLDEAGFEAGVNAVRAAIGRGDVYQVNLTRVLRAPLPSATKVPTGATTDIAALGAALAEGNPAPFSAVIRLPRMGVHLASASPERFVSRAGRRVWSSPIKGTAATADGFLAKDRAENVMIVDLVRNDLGRVCEHGSIRVDELCSVQAHPGLVHLVSTVEGRLRENAGWAQIIDATFPPGSVTGAPKLAALDHIARLEPMGRSWYCGAIGVVDASAGTGDLNVAIRTFWIDDDHLHFGTGGGITWDSDPAGEWAETELKAATLLGLASRRGPE